MFGAVANTATGQLSVTADGSSGSLSHSEVLTLWIQASVATNLPQTA
jgi:hypothetical protein